MESSQSGWIRSSNCLASNSSLACDRSAGITRERVTGERGTRTHPSDLSVLRGGRHNHRTPPFGRDHVESILSSKRCRDPAKECHAIAALCTPSSDPT
jgi:hypothetical protein